MSERYRVGSVTCITINPNAISYGAYSRPMAVLWYVHDSAYCYEIVAGGRFGKKGEQAMRALAAELNEADERG